MKKERVIVIATILTMIAVSLVGFTYAYFQSTSEQLITNTLEIGCMELTFEEANEGINIKNAYPITDAQGMSLTPYTFTLTNNCTIFTKYTIALEVLNTTTLSADYVDFALNQDEIRKLGDLSTTTPTIEGATAYVLQEGNMSQGDTMTYNLRIWLSEDVTISDDAMNKLFNAKVTIKAVPNEFTVANSGITKLSDFLLANEYQISDVEEAKSRIEARGEPDFSKTSPVTLHEEAHEANVVKSIHTTRSTVYIATSYDFDTYSGTYTLKSPQLKYYTDLDLTDGNTYYTCGSQDILSDGSYTFYKPTACDKLFKIDSVSSFINSEGTTLYVLDATRYIANVVETSIADSGIYQTIDDDGISYYYRGLVNNNNIYFAGFYWRIIRINGDGSIRIIYDGALPNDAEKYIGLSQFNTINTKSVYNGYMYGDPDGTTTDMIYDNTNDSEIKKVVDDWYESNLKNTEYEKYLHDTIFCGDRSLSSTSVGDGISTSVNTDYGAFSRNFINKSPSLLCPKLDRDGYTTVNSEIGNKALKYPIGLISADEGVMAGFRYGYVNTNSYLYSHTFWTMSSHRYLSSYSGIANVILSSTGKMDSAFVNSKYGVRPVINLKPEVLVTGGNGTSTDPFTVAMPE